MPVRSIIIAAPGELNSRKNVRSRFYYSNNVEKEAEIITEKMLQGIGPFINRPFPSGEDSRLMFMSLADNGYDFANRLKMLNENLEIFLIENLSLAGNAYGLNESDMEIILDQIAITKKSEGCSDVIIIANPRSIPTLLINLIDSACVSPKDPHITYGEAIIYDLVSGTIRTISHLDI